MTMYRHIKSKLYVSFDDLIKQYLSSHTDIDAIMSQNTISLIIKLSKNYDIVIVTKLNILIIKKH